MNEYNVITKYSSNIVRQINYEKRGIQVNYREFKGDRKDIVNR